MFKVGDKVKFKDLSDREIITSVFGMKCGEYELDDDIRHYKNKGVVTVVAVHDDGFVNLDGLMYYIPEKILEYAYYSIGDIVKCNETATMNTFEGVKEIVDMFIDVCGNALYRVEGDDWLYPQSSLILVEETSNVEIKAGDKVAVGSKITPAIFIKSVFGAQNETLLNKLLSEHFSTFMRNELTVEEVVILDDKVWVKVEEDIIYIPMSILKKVG
jgi:hypothetical protein